MAVRDSPGVMILKNKHTDIARKLVGRDAARIIVKNGM